jgi:XTP/dITP diphosphohydrolase
MERTALLRVLVATNNAGKLREYRQLLQDLPVEPVSPAELGLVLDVDETGETFADNARLKAEAFAAASGLPTLADDSGVEVDVLGGEPGVRSARYGGPGLTEADRYRLLLDRLTDVRWEQRVARFRCVIALAVDGHADDRPAGKSAVAPPYGPAPHLTKHVSFAEGRCEGFIARGPRGANGFGYDPVFFLAEFGLTMAELADEAKNRISHRARAVQRVKAILGRELNAGPSVSIETDMVDLAPVLSEVCFRPLRAADVPSLVQRCGLAEDELRLAMAGADAAPALVAELAGQAVAVGVLKLHGASRSRRWAEVSRLAVASSAPVPGIDQALLHVLEEVARDRDAELA